MITDAILNFFYTLAYLILTPIRNLGNATISANVASSLSTAGSYIQNVDNFLPVGTLLGIIGAMITIEVFYFAEKLIVWTYHQFWGSN